MTIRRQTKAKKTRRYDGPDALAVAARLRELNAEQHQVLNEKLDDIKSSVEKLVGASVSQGKELAAQNEILKEHVRRTHLLEIQVSVLNKFRNAVTAVAAFIVAASGVVGAFFKLTSH